MRYATLTLRVYRDGKLWTAESLELGVASCGWTPNAAIRHAQNACALHLEGLIEALGLQKVIEKYRLETTDPSPGEQVSVLVPLPKNGPVLS